MTNIVKNKNGIEFDIDAIATDLNGKMDRDGINAECPTLLSRTPNNQGGVVEIWSDGYCVQTGVRGSTPTNTNITFDVSYINTAYGVLISSCSVSDSGSVTLTARLKTTSGFQIGASSTAVGVYWRAEGYIR